MKYIIWTFSTLLFLFSCSNNHKASIPKTTAPAVEAIPYDTIIIDYDLGNAEQEKLNASYKNLSIAESILVLKSISKLQGITEINEDGLPFEHKTNALYYRNTVPPSIYSMIFPDETILFDKRRFTNPIIDEAKKTITIQKGLKITEERKFKTLLSLIEKENYLQLLLTNQEKYGPGVELITVSKKDFFKIDQLNLYGGIYDSYDIDYWHSSFTKDHQDFKLTSVKNTEFNDIKLDTIITTYTISSSGIISKK